MSTHAIEVVASTTNFTETQFSDAINTAITGYTQCCKDQRTTPMTAGGDIQTEHYRAIYRFDESHTMSDIITDIQTELDNVGSWDFYQISTHTCYHDQDQPSPCAGWTADTSTGTVPSDLSN